MNVTNKCISPRCPSCNHVLRFVKKKNLWSCTWCDVCVSKEDAKGLYPPEVPDTYDINDITIFRKQDAATPAAPVATAAPTTVDVPAPVSATPICAAPVALPEPVVCEAQTVPVSVAVADVADAIIDDVDFSTIEPVTTTTPFRNANDVIDEVFGNKDSPEPRRAKYDTDNHPKLQFFNKMKSMPDFKPVPAELQALGSVGSRFSLREGK